MNNWIVGNLQASFDTWNEKLTEIWSLVTTTPQAFRGGEIWNTIVTINDGLKAFGYGLLVLFFAMSVFRSAASFRDLQRPEFALRHFIRFIIAKVAVGSAMEIMTAVFSVCGGVVQSIMGSIGGMSAASVTLPQEIADAIEEVGFFQSVPLWMVTFLGSLFITVLSFILIMTVYGRFFRLYMFTALAPLPLASFAGEDTSFMGKAFLKSYLGVCMEGAIVVLACLIFSAFAASGAPIADTSLPVVTMSWQYVAQTIFNMLILVALIKGAERIAKDTGCQMLITGENLGQVASQTAEALVVTDASVSLPVMRPLIAMDKVDIMAKAEEIGTFETSIQPYEDCCTVFLPKHPTTKPKLERILESERKLDCEALIEAAIKAQEIVNIMPE